MRQINFKGEKYDVVAEFGDLILQSTDRDFIFERGYTRLMNDGIAELGTYTNDTTRDCDGQSLDYNKDLVTEFVNENIEIYIHDHEAEAVEIVHQNN